MFFTEITDNSDNPLSNIKESRNRRMTFCSTMDYLWIDTNQDVPSESFVFVCVNITESLCV